MSSVSNGSVIEKDFIATGWKEKTYRKNTGCGNIYIIVGYYNDPEKHGKIELILINGDKENRCGNSFFNTCADDLTFMIKRIRNHHEAIAICKNYRFHRCNNIKPSEDHVVSCVDAIGQVIQTELNVTDKELWGK